MKIAWTGIACLALAFGSYAAGEEVKAAPTTQPAAIAPATQPANAGLSSSSAASTLDRMLRTKPGTVRPLQPAPEEDQTRARSVNKLENESVDLMLKREGDLITERVGRLQEATAGWEFHFESDGRALNDPPMIVLPNSNLARMEAATEKSGRDLRFKVTGMITTYHGRNYLLVEKATAVSRADEE